MRDVIVVTGTGTEVGKTWCTARLVTALRGLGLRSVARKPVQSFEPGSGPTDADILAEVSGEHPHSVCPRHRWYELALAPPMAAQALRRPEPRMGQLAREFRASAEIIFVEGVGGVRSPLAIDGDTADLARMLDARWAILVARPDLGTINEVRLGRDALADLDVIVFLNRFDPFDDLHRRNRDWLRHYDGLTVHTDVDSIAERLLARHSLEVT
jgi:dethiobiotin synthetase